MFDKLKKMFCFSPTIVKHISDKMIIDYNVLIAQML